MKGSFWSRNGWLLHGTLLVLCGAILFGCGNGEAANTTATVEEGDHYRIGEPVSDSTVAAIVLSDEGSDTLTTERFQTQIERFLSQSMPTGIDEEQFELLRRSVVEDFVMRYVLAEEAEARGITVDSAEVSTQLEGIRARFPDEETFEAIMAQQGMTIDSLRSALTAELKMRQLQQQIAESAPAPTADELAAFQEEQAQEVSAQHILFMTQQADEATRDSLRQVAEAVLDSAQSGVDFAELARRHSDDGSAETGGELGFFGRGMMVPPFEEAAFAIADSGDVYPEVVETRFGYHIIRKTGSRAAAPIDSAQAQAMLTRRRQQETLQEGFDELRQNVVVRLNPDIVQADLNAEVPEM